MGGGDLNLKKSWHPGTFRNQEKVWKEERKAADEEKKLQQLRKELEEERQIQELQRIQEQAGGKKRTDRLDWMYQAAPTGAAQDEKALEDYLLGKRRVDDLLNKKDGSMQALSKTSDAFMNQPSKANSVRDIQAKVREDPLLAIKRREQASMEALMKNPIKMRQLKEGKDPNKKKSKKSKDDKADKDERRKDKSDHRSRKRRSSRDLGRPGDSDEDSSDDRNKHSSRKHQRRSPSPDRQSPNGIIVSFSKQTSLSLSVSTTSPVFLPDKSPRPLEITLSNSSTLTITIATSLLSTNEHGRADRSTPTTTTTTTASHNRAQEDPAEEAKRKAALAEEEARRKALLAEERERRLKAMTEDASAEALARKSRLAEIAEIEAKQDAEEEIKRNRAAKDGQASFLKSAQKTAYDGMSLADRVQRGRATLQSIEALERQYSTHDDQLSEDEEDDDTRRPSPLLQDHQHHAHGGVTAQGDGSSRFKDHKKSNTAEDEDEQRPWNVPDEEWEWSEEEPTSFSAAAAAITNSSRSGPSHASSTTTTTRHGSNLAVPTRSSKNIPVGLGLTDPTKQSQQQQQQQDTQRSAGSTSLQGISASSSPRTKAAQLADSTSSSPMISGASVSHSHPLSVAQDLRISVCDSGRYIACASKKMFAILQRQSHPSTTSNSPTPLSTAHEWVLSGHLVVIQQLHHTPVISIKARIGVGKVSGEDEDEMTILHEGGKVVCIEGESLWVVLRLSNGSSRSAYGDGKSVQASQAPTFAYKKWSLQNQDLMVDIISCGPARHRPTLSNGFSSSSSSSMYTSQATERFVSVGSKPMMAFYASSSSGRTLFSATSLATQMAARVTSAVFGFAKSIWGSSPSPRPGSPALGSSSGRATPDQKRLSGQGGAQDGAMGPYGNIYSSAMAPATEVPAVLWLSDSQRCIRHLSLAPTPLRGSCYHYPSKLAAMTDSLGRVLLVDLEECEIIRMWKGLRGARCGWIQEERFVRSVSRVGGRVDEESPMRRHLILYLVIYAPKRGTVEIYPARQGKRVGLLQVGLGWKICTTFTTPIGKPVLLDRLVGSPKPGGPAFSSPTFGSPTSSPATTLGEAPLGLSQCLLIGPTGEVRRVGSRLTDSLSPSQSASPQIPAGNGQGTS
ncbi:RNA-splicing factor [Dissophora globulifera]|nr:RNA-splicing factor [Dissophora globulifera]